MFALSLGLALLLAAVHVAAGRLRSLGGAPRSVLLSAAGGASVAYVFVHLLPRLAEGQEALGEVAPLATFEAHVWLVALVGLGAFYGLERAAAASRRGQEDDVTEREVFWVHTASFALFNALVGYLLLRGEVASWASLLLFGAAMGLHFLVNDYALRQHHRHRYRAAGRWVLAAAVLGGWALGAATEVGEAALAVALAFVGGGLVLNVLKEELPEERESRFWAFALGAAAYTALLLAAEAAG